MQATIVLTGESKQRAYEMYLGMQVMADKMNQLYLASNNSKNKKV